MHKHANQHPDSDTVLSGFKYISASRRLNVLQIDIVWRELQAYSLQSDRVGPQHDKWSDSSMSASAERT